MPRFTARSQKWLLILTPSVLLVAFYMLLSVLYINTTDQHLLFSASEQQRPHLGLYDRFVTTLHQKMLFTSVASPQKKQKPKPKPVQAVHAPSRK